MVSMSRIVSCSAILLLSACASQPPAPPPPPVEAPAVVEVTVQPTAEKDALGAYRFHMSDGEKKMTADEFDAWMKANGIRVARGAPAPAPAATEEAKAESTTTY